jgi:hypothetical protein
MYTYREEDTGNMFSYFIKILKLVRLSEQFS